MQTITLVTSTRRPVHSRLVRNDLAPRLRYARVSCTENGYPCIAALYLDSTTCEMVAAKRGELALPITDGIVTLPTTK